MGRKSVGPPSVSELADVLPGSGFGTIPDVAERGAPPSRTAGIVLVARESRRILSLNQVQSLKAGMAEAAGRLDRSTAELTTDCLALVPLPAGAVLGPVSGEASKALVEATAASLRGMKLPRYPGLRFAVPAVPDWTDWGGAIAIGYTDDPMVAVLSYYCRTLGSDWRQTVLRMENEAEAVQFSGVYEGQIGTITVAHFPGDTYATALRFAECALPPSGVSAGDREPGAARD